MKTILITGGTSMIGRAIQNEINKDLYRVIAPTKEELNLLSLDQTQAYFRNYLPHQVIHLAGINGGIGYNKSYPATIYFSTVQMGLNVLKCSSDYGIEKTVSLLASCSYPDGQSDNELAESSLHLGPPNPSVECHGQAKRTLEIYARQLRSEFQVNAISLVMNNSFGPYDRFDPQRSKVVGGLIKRFVEAKKNNEPSITCWGDGSPLREFVYCKDAAKLILSALQNYNEPTPLNIGSPSEVSIKTVANTIAEAVDYKGQIIWDTSKANGQMRKKLDLTKMNAALLDKKFEYTPFPTAIAETVNWYMENPTWAK